MGVVVLAQDALEIDALAGTIDGAVGEQIGGDGLHVILHGDAELPG
jgi:hypothetical protein